MENTLQEIKRFLTHLICQHAFSPRQSVVEICEHSSLTLMNGSEKQH